MHLRPTRRARAGATWVRPAAIAGVLLLTLLAVFAAAEPVRSVAGAGGDRSLSSITSGSDHPAIEIAVPRAVPRAMVPRVGIVTIVAVTLVAFGVVLVLSASGSVIDDRRRRWRARLVGAPPVLLGIHPS